MAFLVIRIYADESQQCFLFCCFHYFGHIPEFCCIRFLIYRWVMTSLVKPQEFQGLRACIKFRLTLLNVQEIQTHRVLSLYPDSATWCYELNGEIDYPSFNFFFTTWHTCQIDLTRAECKRCCCLRMKDIFFCDYVSILYCFCCQTQNQMLPHSAALCLPH